MKIRTYYILLFASLHIGIIILSIHYISIKPLFFLFIEGLVLISILFTFSLYKTLIQPVNLIVQGVDTIKEKDFTVKLVPTGRAEIDQLIRVYNTMIDQLRMERIHLEEQHYFLQKLIEASPAGIIILDPDHKVSHSNRAACELIELNESELLGYKFAMIKNPVTFFLDRLEEEKVEIMVKKGVHRIRCRKSHFIDSGFKRTFYILEELTTELHQIEKRSYERVIRMMAHEVNNSVGAINSILDSCLYFRQQLGDNDQKEFNTAINVSKERNQHLNKFIKNFADVVRLSQPEKTISDVNRLAERVYQVMRHHCENNGISLNIKLSEQPITVGFDRDQMEQVLVNIIKNAIESIERNGQIIIETVEQPPAISILDNGKGISPEAKNQLFTPFFSTKKSGQGIGLTMVKEILLNHNFSFFLETRKSGLTVFNINF